MVPDFIWIFFWSSLILCIWMFCLHLSLHITLMPRVSRGQKRVPDLWKESYRQLWAVMLVLETKPRFSSALNCWALSLVFRLPHILWRPDVMINFRPSMFDVPFPILSWKYGQLPTPESPKSLCCFISDVFVQQGRVYMHLVQCKTSWT